MKIYNYDKTGRFVGESLADESPLEPGVFLIPAYATEIPPPEVGAGEYANFALGSWSVVTVPVQLIEQIATMKKALVQVEKCRIRDGGVLVDGVLFDTDMPARIAYMELFTQFSVDPTFTVTWKASESHWVIMTAAMYQQVMAAGKAHIESAFAWQAQKDAEIDAAVLAEDRETLIAIATTME